MDPALAIVLSAGILGAAAVVVALLRRPPPATPATDAAPVIDLLRSSVDELRGSTAAAIGEMRTELQRTLGATEQQLTTQTTSTQRAL
ncbi:MAG TPA: hypothetical protein VFV20_05735, partial [Candidatus Limnocylindria bacterium]|nr:hypothetical protein [Candidatus Limnocylindria bacterium]